MSELGGENRQRKNLKLVNKKFNFKCEAYNVAKKKAWKRKKKSTNLEQGEMTNWKFEIKKKICAKKWIFHPEAICLLRLIPWDPNLWLLIHSFTSVGLRYWLAKLPTIAAAQNSNSTQHNLNNEIFLNKKFMKTFCGRSGHHLMFKPIINGNWMWWSYKNMCKSAINWPNYYGHAFKNRVTAAVEWTRQNGLIYINAWDKCTFGISLINFISVLTFIWWSEDKLGWEDLFFWLNFNLKGSLWLQFRNKLLLLTWMMLYDEY